MIRFDRVIPPGGKGELTIQINTEKVRGEFQKKAAVWSNDFEGRKVALSLTGEVKPYIALDPGAYLSLWGVIGRVPKEHLRIINHDRRPLRIMGMDNDLSDHIIWRLKEIKPGYLYDLEVEDISRTTGSYSGHLYVRTDHPKKPELVIVINGEVEEDKKRLEKP